MIIDSLRTLLISVVSIGIGSKYFPEYILFASSALIAIGLGGKVGEYLKENRDAIWRGDSSYKVNRSLTEKLLMLFVSIFAVGVGYFVCFRHMLDRSFSVATREPDVVHLLLHNSGVLVVSVVFGLLYGGSGLMLLLSWNALSWAKSFVVYGLEIFSTKATISGVALYITLVPHLLLEVSAYVLGGMSGIFFSKAIRKYSINSLEFSRVSTACLFLLLYSGILLVLAACFENMVFFKLVRQLLN